MEKRVLVFFLNLFLLMGCRISSSTSSSISLTVLDMVAHIEIIEDTLTWDPVPFADYYQVSINNKTLEYVRSTSVNLIQQTIDYGSLTIIISAHQEGAVSLSSESFVVLEYHPSVIPIPRNLIINNHLLTWDAIAYATGYEVTINGVATSITTPSFDLSTLDPNGFFSIEVKTLYFNRASEPSLSLHYESQFDSLGILELSQTKNTTQEPLEWVLDSLEGTILQVNYLGEEDIVPTFEGNTVRLSLEEFLLLSYGIHYFKVYTTTGLVELQIQVVDDRAPFMISDHEIVVLQGENAPFTFELYDGYFTSVSGNDITAEDYKVEGSILIIQSTYIDTIFQEDEGRQVIILAYSITANDHIVIGYLFIRRPPIN